MEQRFDSEMMIERARGLAKEIRQSEAYPAIIGGIAGGIAGALMAALIASQFSGRAEPAATKEERRRAQPGFDVREVVKLVTVVAALVKQVRDWYAQEQKK
jgi:hypothetical protein